MRPAARLTNPIAIAFFIMALPEDGKRRPPSTRRNAPSDVAGTCGFFCQKLCDSINGVFPPGEGRQSNNLWLGIAATENRGEKPLKWLECRIRTPHRAKARC